LANLNGRLIPVPGDRFGRRSPPMKPFYGFAILILSLHLFTAGAVAQNPNKDSKKNSLGMEFVLIPKGEFEMGSSNQDINEILAECKRAGSACKKEAYADERPKRKVVISQPFLISRFEVTQAQWEKVMGTNPSLFKDCGPECPVDNVSWNDAKRFVSNMNARADGFVYSLPSESQWEYVARAGSVGPRYGPVNDVAWFSGNSNASTHKVGMKSPNSFGVYDILGNVWEWVEDYYSSEFNKGIPLDGSPNLSVGMPLIRVAKGCYWGCSDFNTRTSFRFNNLTSEKNNGNGLRLIAAEK